MRLIKISLIQFVFFFICTLLFASSSPDKVYDFYHLKKDQRPAFIINETKSANSIDAFTGYVCRANGANFKTIVDSLKISSEQKVYNVSFVVDKNGRVKNIAIDSENEQIRRLFKTLYGIETEGKWIPGKIDGNPVDVRVPFIFSLKMGFVSIIIQQN